MGGKNRGKAGENKIKWNEANLTFKLKQSGPLLFVASLGKKSEFQIFSAAICFQLNYKLMSNHKEFNIIHLFSRSKFDDPQILH